MARTYKEIMDDLQNAEYGKECRKLHKELKQVHKGEGLPLFMRYPHLPDIFTALAVAILLVKIFLLDNLQ